MRPAPNVLSTMIHLLLVLFLTLSVTTVSADTNQDKGQSSKGGGTQSQSGDQSGNQAQGQGDQKGGTKSKSDSSSSSNQKDSGSKVQGAAAEQAPIESEMLAFRGLRDDAAKIFARIKSALATPADPNTSNSVIIYDAAQYKLIPTYRAFNGQFGLMIQSYCGVLNQPTISVTPPGGGHKFSVPLTGILTGAQAVNTTVAGILDTLKTTSDLTANNFTVTDDTLVAEVANLFKSSADDIKRTQVIYPAMYPLEIPAPDSKEVPSDVGAACDATVTSSATQRLYALIFLRSAADSLSQAVQKRISDLDKSIDEKSKKKPATDIEKSLNQQEIDNAKNEKEQWNAVAQKITGLNKGTDAFLAALTKADESGGTPALNNLFAAERLSAALAKLHSYTLALKIQKNGGQMLKKSNLFYGTRFYYGGGSIVSFFLFDADGGVMSSGNFMTDTSYVRDKSLRHVSE